MGPQGQAEDGGSLAAAGYVFQSRNCGGKYGNADAPLRFPPIRAGFVRYGKRRVAPSDPLLPPHLASYFQTSHLRAVTTFCVRINEI